MQPQTFLNRQIREYLFSEVIGIGGMGAVFKCMHVRLKAVRAVKVLRPDLLRDPSFKARFEKEARILAQLENPHLIRVYEFFEEEGHLFLVMEYVFGESFADRIEYAGSINVEKAVAITSQVCDGLAHAHAQGIVHRDLSPDNILITTTAEGEFVKIIDFGIAKSIFGEMESTSLAAEGLTTPGIFIGKVKYCSPEQASGKDLDHRSDQYSLALILYEAISGKSPFQGETLMESLTQRLVSAPPKLTKVMEGKKISSQLEEVLVRALEINPANRFSDIRGFKDALISAIQKKAVEDFSVEKKDPIDLVIDPFEDDVTIQKKTSLPKRAREALTGLTSIADDMMDSSSRSLEMSHFETIPASIRRKTEPVSTRRPSKSRRWPWIVAIILLWSIGGLGIYIYFFEKTTLSRFFEKTLASLTGDGNTPAKSAPGKGGQTPLDIKSRGKTPTAKHQADGLISHDKGGIDGIYLATDPGVNSPKAISSTMPVLPSSYRKTLKTPLSVNLQAVILRDGRIGQIDILKPGYPEVDQAAIDAVRKWKFQPGTRNSQPADIIIDITVDFK